MKTITQGSMFIDVPIQEIAIKEAPKPKRKRKAPERETVATFLHLGAGVQSSTIAEMIVEGDLPPVTAVIFADTGNEPAWVYKQVDYLKLRLEGVGIPLEIVRKPNSLGIVEDLKSPSLRFATMPLFSKSASGKIAILKRQCTHEFKILPCDDFILEWLLEHSYARRNVRNERRVKPAVNVDNIYGISADEKYRQGKMAQGWQSTAYPLIDKNMGRGDCIAYLLKKGLPVPKKSSCIVCPYHDDAYWLDLYENAPDEFEQACCFDEWLRTPDAKLYGNFRGIKDELYLHSSCTPLRSIDFKKRVAEKKSRQMDMFAAEVIDGAVCATDGGFSCMS